MRIVRGLIPAKIPLLLRLGAIFLGLLHTWAAVASHSMNPDGISYLDIGDAALRGDWATAINPVWSPLYAWILGAVNFVVQPSMTQEFALVQIVNFFVYIGALLAFEFFWREVRREQLAEPGGALLPDWGWFGLGYVLFIWSALSLIELWAVTPDMLMALFVFLAAGFVARLRRGATDLTTYGLLGLMLGMGYLAKSPMFLLSFIFLGVAVFAAGRYRQGLRGATFALLLFLAVSLPYVFLISQAAGKVTFGSAGPVTYIRHVNQIPYPDPDLGPLSHPPQKVHDTPAVYDLNGPVGGTYPLSHDPSYWFAGLPAELDFRQQLDRLLASALFYLTLFLRQEGGVLLGAAVLWWVGRRGRLTPAAVLKKWGLALTAVAALAMYAPVLVEGRYIGPFILLLWADVWGNLRLADTPGSRRLLTGVSAAVILFMVGQIGLYNLEGVGMLASSRTGRQAVSTAAGPPAHPGETALALRQYGIRPGEKVGVIGYAYESFWARLARVRIVAEMFEWEAAPYWQGDADLRAGVISAFAGSGARAIVAERVPADADTSGWLQVGESNYYVYLLGGEE